jgi:hypothetical protein
MHIGSITVWDITITTLDPHMQNLPYGDTHTCTGIPVCIQEEVAKKCEKFLYGDPHQLNIEVRSGGNEKLLLGWLLAS